MSLESASDYNDSDGIALEAGGEVFVVGRNRLVQDSVVFRDMFELSGTNAAGSEPEGTPGHPIPTGDDAAALRDFIWAIRVRPAALLAFIQTENTPEKAVKLINVAKLAHKYQDPSMADWALQQLYETLSPSGFALEGSVLNPLLATLAQFERNDAKVSALTQLLRSRVDEASLQSSSNSLDLIALIEACTHTGFTPLLIPVYNALLIAPGLQSLQWTNDPRISATNKKQLLYGAYRLTEEWDRLLRGCSGQFASRVREKCGSSRPADLLAKMNAACTLANSPVNPDSVQRNYNSGFYNVTYNLTYMQQFPEISPWVAELTKLIASFPDQLGTYFNIEDIGL